MVPAPKEEAAAETTDAMGKIREMLTLILEKNTNLNKIDQMINRMHGMLQAPNQKHRPDIAGVQKEEITCWKKLGVSTDGVTQDTLSTGTLTLHLRPVEGQQGACQHEEERDPL